MVYILNCGGVADKLYKVELTAPSKCTQNKIPFMCSTGMVWMSKEADTQYQSKQHLSNDIIEETVCVKFSVLIK